MADRLRGEQKEMLLSLFKQTLRKPEVAAADNPIDPSIKGKPIERDHKLDALNQAFKEAMRKSPQKPVPPAPKRHFIDVPSSHSKKLQNPMQQLGRQLGENAALLARNIAGLVALNVEDLMYRRP